MSEALSRIATTKWLCSKCLPDRVSIFTVGKIMPIECSNCLAMIPRGKGGCVSSDVEPKKRADIESAWRSVSQLLDVFADEEIEIISTEWHGETQVELTVNGLVFERPRLDSGTLKEILEHLTQGRTNER